MFVLLMGGYGETVGIAQLSKMLQTVALDLEKLGIREQNLEKMGKKTDSRPNGFFCNTGPTGSRKNDSILKALNSPEIKIMTVEDPIEHTVGWDFANTSKRKSRGILF